MHLCIEKELSKKTSVTIILVSLTLLTHAPDLNVIENIWLRITRELRSTVRNIKTFDELFNAINELGTSYQSRYGQTCYDSHPNVFVTMNLFTCTFNGLDYDI